MAPLADVFNHHFQPHATLQSDDVVCPACGSRRECEHDEVRQNLDHQCYSSTIVVGPAKAASNEHLSETGDNDSVEMVATSPVTAGEEVCNTYGKLDNAALLANYGFRLDANEDDKVRWYSFESVLNQAGLQLKQDDTINEWRLHLKDAAFLQDIVCDDRISEERLSNPHLRNLPELLFIDADGNISLYLWLLISTILQNHSHSTQTYSSGDYAVKLIETLVKGRLHQLVGHERDVDELFDLSNQVSQSLKRTSNSFRGHCSLTSTTIQERNSREVKLALSRVIDERLLLTACLAQWVPEDSDEACEGS